MDVYEKPLLSKPSAILLTIVQVITGVDYGYVKVLPKKWGIVVKVITFIFALNISLLLTKPILDYDIGLFYYLFYSIEYLLYTLILIFSKYTLYEYLLAFEDFDSTTVNRKISREVIGKAFLLPLISVIFKIIVSVTYCVCSGKEGFCSQAPVEYFIEALSNYSFDTLLLIQYLIVYTYYRHMSILKSKVVNHECGSGKLLKIYKNILDSVDKIKPLFDKLIVTSVFVAVPRYMATEYMILHEVKMHQNWILLLLQYSLVLEMGFLMSLPSLTAETINAQSDEIILTLHNDLIETTDHEKRFEIKETLRYMNARPSQYYVWRRIPVDTRLPMAIVSVMTTYLIVIIQFTHLFD